MGTFWLLWKGVIATIMLGLSIQRIILYARSNIGGSIKLIIKEMARFKPISSAIK
jgi:hypothetical protein